MIDPYNVVEFEDMLKSFDPPVVTCGLVILPAVNRIAPQLTGRGKRVRRHACYYGRKPVFVKFKKFGMTPCIRAVKGHIDRNIADDPDALTIGVFLELFPLFREEELQELVKPDLLVEFNSVTVHGCSSAKPYIFGPEHEHIPVKIFLHRAEQRVIRKPFGVVPPEILEGSPVAFISILRPLPRRVLTEGAVRVRPAKQGIPVPVDFLIVYSPGLFSKIKLIRGFSVNITRLDQCLGVYEIRITCKC